MTSLFKKLTVFFVGAALVGGTVVAVGATTASATVTRATQAVGLTFPGGAGHAGTVWAGTYANGNRGFCLDFGAATPNWSAISPFTWDVPGMSPEESKQAKFVANKYSLTLSRDVAANAGFAIWRYQHDGAFNTWYGWARSKGVVSTARHNAISAIMSDAAQHAPYKVALSTTTVLVGQKGSGVVKLLGSNGRPAAGRAVLLGSTGAKILTVNTGPGNKGMTTSTGMVGFTYQRTSTAKVIFAATLTSPSTAKAGISITTAGHQRTLSGGYTEKAIQYFSYIKEAGRPTISTLCDTDCDGQSTVTFAFANPVGAQHIKWTEKVGATVVATLSVKPGTTGTKTARLNDGTVITGSSYCYTGSVLGGPCTTPTVAITFLPYEIVCPAWAQAEIVRPCNCTPNQPVTVTLTSPAGSPRFYRGFVTVNNGKALAKDLVNGKPGTITTAKLGKNSNIVVSFTVYRDAKRTIPMTSYVLKKIRVY